MGEALVQDVDRGVLDVGLPVAGETAPGTGEGVVVLDRDRVVEIVLVEQAVERGEVVIEPSCFPAEVHEERAETALGADLDEVGVAPGEGCQVPGRCAVPVRNSVEAAAQVVAPLVVVDLDRWRRPLFRAHRETAVVGADVVKGPQHPVVAAHQHQRLAEKLDRAHVTGIGQGRLEGERHPVPVEDSLHLEIEEGRGAEGPCGQGERPFHGGADRVQILGGQPGFCAGHRHCRLPASGICGRRLCSIERPVRKLCPLNGWPGVHAGWFFEHRMALRASMDDPTERRGTVPAIRQRLQHLRGERSAALFLEIDRDKGRQAHKGPIPEDRSGDETPARAGDRA